MQRREGGKGAKEELTTKYIRLREAATADSLTRRKGEGQKAELLREVGCQR